MLAAMVEAAPSVGVECFVSEKGYRGDCGLLMTYGTGHEVRRPYWQKQIKRGGRCIGWDLGYWRPAEEMRVTLDTDHPPQWIRDEPSSRWDAQQIELRNDYDANGPIVLVGMGNKAARLHAGGPMNWELRTFHKLKKAFPHRPIVFRPKGRNAQRIRGATTAALVPIESVLQGASLVVCRHSNVAVDACIAGIPVVCEDGAARAIYNNDFRNPNTPTVEQRLAFLRGLAWWNWHPTEAADAWRYLLGRL